jgi:hypothetical protein
MKFIFEFDSEGRVYAYRENKAQFEKNETKRQKNKTQRQFGFDLDEECRMLPNEYVIIDAKGKNNP